MFQPGVYREDRIDLMQALMKAHPFASLVSLQDGDLVADHIPLMIHPELSEKGVLRGHISRSNPISKHLDESIDALVIFSGPHHYITPAWYPSKAEHEKVVPTWNYIMVHARGKITFKTDPHWMLTHLTALTDHNEAKRKTPWKVSDAPDDYIARQFRGIIGIEIDISQLQGTWKVSQNKNEKDNQGVVDGLTSESTEAANNMAINVRQRKSNLK